MGLTLGQCSGAAIFVDDRIVFSSSEERYSRIKSDESYPLESINDGLRYCKIKPAELDRVIIAGNAITLMPVLLRTFSSFSIDDHLMAMKEYWYPKLTEGREVSMLKLFKHKISTDKYPFNSRLAKELKLSEIKYPITKENERQIAAFFKKAISEHLGIDDSKIIHLDHHSCHAAYALYGSPIRKNGTLVFTADAWGDDLSGSISIFENNRIRRVKAHHHKDFQLARIYRYTTLYLRMLPNEHEYKVMGLAPYYTGQKKTAEVEKVFESMQSLEGLDFRFNPKVKDIYHYLEENLDSFRFDHIAAGLQSFTEKMLGTWFRRALKHYKSDTAVFSGGVSLNVKANKTIMELEGLKDFFVCGGGGDESLSIGACYLHAESRNVAPQPLENLYLGPNCEYGDRDVKRMSQKYKVHPYDPDRIVNMLIDGKVVATCFGRMEMGPRALCNRSILADPRVVQNVEKINRKIKNRDFWMPFAPVILDEYQDAIIENPKRIRSPYMTIAFDTRDGKQKLPAAVHMYDGTARPLILKRQDNPVIWDVIKRFYDLTGVPVLVNTSFNLHGEPLVNTLKDALYVFENSGLDVLWLENHIVEK
jgi:carbamoyltransferase